MLKVILEGHDNYYGIADILRLFYDKVSEDHEGHVVTSPDGPNMTIISSSEEALKDYGSIPQKRAVKLSLYKKLSDLTGKTYPWGCLTGIRPTVVASEEVSPQALTEKYLVRPDKAELAFTTAVKEKAVIERRPKEDINIYIGVPFCPSRCEYCSFISQDAVKHLGSLKRYRESLLEEIRSVAPFIKRNIASVYMGGGTPTVFEDGDFEDLILSISEILGIKDDNEFTVEAGRHDTITRRKLMTMKKAGADRVCINPQTTNDETLRKLNRLHGKKDTFRCFEMAREEGFEVINMDLIAGLKYEDDRDFTNSLKDVIGLGPENITIHTLYKKRRASITKQDVLDREGSRGEVDKALSEGYGMLSGSGYAPYYLYRQKDTGHGLENTGFALEGTECYYNVAMMGDRRDVLSFGAGGVSKRIFEGGRLERLNSIKDVTGYMDNVPLMAQRKISFFEE